MSKTLTEQQKAFIRCFSISGNATQSAIDSGYSKNTAQQQGYELKHKLANEIDNETKKVLTGSVPMAVDVLKKLIHDSKIPPSTRLQAVNSLLDRTGYSSSSITQIQDITHKRSDADLRQELNHLLHTLHMAKPIDDNGNGGNGSIN